MRSGRGWGGLVAVVAVLGLAACAGTAEAGTDGPELGGRSFVSTSVTGHDLVEGTRVSLIFQSDRISVQAGCNTLTGGAEWADGVLRLGGEMATTMMACDADLMDQDQWLAAFLASEPALELDGTTLTLGDEAEAITFDEQ